MEKQKEVWIVLHYCHTESDPSTLVGAYTKKEDAIKAITNSLEEVDESIENYNKYEIEGNAIIYGLEDQEFSVHRVEIQEIN